MIDFMATSSEVSPCYMLTPIRPPATPPNSGVAGSLEEAAAQFKRLNDDAKQPFYFSAADSGVLASAKHNPSDRNRAPRSGLALGPAAGRLIAEMMTGATPS
jgi:hypothetical protein